MSVRIIQTNVKIKNKFENRKIELLDFRYFNTQNFEISAVLHLIVPNVDPQLFSEFPELEFFGSFQCRTFTNFQNFTT